MTDSKKSLWFQSLGVVHTNMERAGQTRLWSGMDSLQRFSSHYKDVEKKELLESLGWLDPDCIRYNFNHQGFRCDEFDNRPAGIAIGCSFTEGVGIPVTATWPHVLSELMSFHVWNLGLGGASMDACFRVLDFYIDILNVKFVVICQPPNQRFEYFNKHNIPRQVLARHLDDEPHKHFAQEWMVSDTNTGTNARRNLLAMKYRCYEKDVPCFAFPNHPWLRKDVFARDLAHPGVKSNHEFAHKIYETIKNKTPTLTDTV